MSVILKEAIPLWQVLARLEQAEEAVVLDLDSWARLCLILLPELYTDAGEPAEPCPAPPGTLGREQTLAGRADRGEVLHHPEDASEPGDRLALVRPGDRRGCTSIGRKPVWAEVRPVEDVLATIESNQLGMRRPSTRYPPGVPPCGGK